MDASDHSWKRFFSGCLGGISFLVLLILIGSVLGVFKLPRLNLLALQAALRGSPLPTPTWTPTITPTPTPTSTPLPIREKAIVQDVYAVVRYITAPDVGEITREDVRRRWFQPAQPPLYVTQDAYEGLTKIFFAPPGTRANVHVVSSAQALAASLRAHPEAWGILPFDQLIPLLVPLRFEGVDLLDPTLSHKDLNDYFLSRSRIVLHTWPHSNRDPEQFHVMWVGGSTTLKGSWTKFFASAQMAAQAVKPLHEFWQRSDRVHVHLDVPLKPSCADEDTTCVKPEVFHWLVTEGVNQVDLASPYVAQAGRGAALYTRKELEHQGVHAFGVGRLRLPDVAYTWTPSGHRIALIGAGVPDGVGQWATPQEPGPIPLYPDRTEEWVWMLERLARGNDTVILFLRWKPVYDVIGPRLRWVFDALHRAGANAVIGVQPGRPQPVAFDEEGIRAYGLGSFLSHREPRALALRLYFYQGRLIGVRPDLLIREENRWRRARGAEQDVLRQFIEAP